MDMSNEQIAITLTEELNNAFTTTIDKFSVEPVTYPVTIVQACLCFLQLNFSKCCCDM